MTASISNQGRSIFQFHDFENARKRRQAQWLNMSQFNGNTQIVQHLGLEDLTQQVYENKCPPCIGMSKEIRDVFIVLKKRWCNTPLIYGENGVGKSTLPIGLSHRIVNGRAPRCFQSSRILSLNLALLTAGAGIRGEVARRLKNYFSFLDNNPQVITVIDECQLLVDKDFMDSEITHFLKLNLSSGKYRMILITDAIGIRLLTEDAAIMGRVVPVEISPSNERKVRRMFIAGLRKELTEHHDLDLPISMVNDAYRLSEEVMLYDRAQPARTIKLLDTAMAKESLKHELLYTSSKRLQHATLEETARSFSGADHRSLTHEERLSCLGSLEKTLKNSVIGQNEIIQAVCTDLTIKYTHKPSKIGAYFFYGDSGTGKTELATQIGRHLSGNDSVIRVDCSQLIDRWASTTLLGSFPGLIMSDRSSMLSKVRLNPYATFIWDEIEKAHPEVILLFLQILQPPYTIVDNRGVKLDFSKSLFFFTSNIGHSDADKKQYGFKGQHSNRAVKLESMNLTSYFPNEFLGRLGSNIYRFNPLTVKDLEKIFDLELAKIADRYKVKITATTTAKQQFIDTTTSSRFGVRALQAELARTIEPELIKLIRQDNQHLFKLRIMKNRNKLIVVADTKNQ